MSEVNVLYNINLLKILPFYNVLIDFMSTAKAKKLTNADFLNELPFCDCLTVGEVSEAFRRYARKDPLAQLNSRKASIKDLFKLLLRRMKGFEYVLTMSITLRVKIK